MGQQKVSPASVSTHQGGAFYNYYVKVTGHAPPASVQTSNFIYQAWKSGVKATALQGGSAPHPSSKNTQIAHPNSNHAPRTQVAHPNTPKAAPAKPKAPAKPAAKAPPKPAPKPAPPPKTKPKASGPRK
jgi:cell division septation protein DedD